MILFLVSCGDETWIRKTMICMVICRGKLHAGRQWRALWRMQNLVRATSMKSSWSVAPHASQQSRIWLQSWLAGRNPIRAWTLMRLWQSVLPSRLVCWQEMWRTLCCWTWRLFLWVSRLLVVWPPCWSPGTPPSQPRRRRPHGYQTNVQYHHIPVEKEKTCGSLFLLTSKGLHRHLFILLSWGHL